LSSSDNSCHPAAFPSFTSSSLRRSHQKPSFFGVFCRNPRKGIFEGSCKKGHDAHDLHNQTLLGLKRLVELIRRCGGRLSVVLAGHPKLKNDLRRPALEEIGSRASVFELEGIKGHQRRYLAWLLEQCTRPKVKPNELLTEQALERLAECLTTPLQIEHYLILALEQAYRFGEKPVTPEIVEAVMAPDMEALEPTLARQGYNAKALAELLNVRHAEIRAFLHSQLPPGRAEELKQ
jgi:hypothetical protein